ncbi:MAG: diaminopimelate epimerase [Thiohalospira sp.]
MTLEFTKMQGLGNDFVVIDNRGATFDPTPERIRWLADRRFGVGCDQVLLVEAAPDDAVDFGYRIFNADGGEVDQCGNGARCFARWVREHTGFTGNPVRVATRAGQMALTTHPDGRVDVDMGQPRFEPAAIPFETPERADEYMLEVEGRTFRIGAVGLGNPHAVMRVEALDRVPVATLGAAIQALEAFPEGVNVGFVEAVGRDHIRLRVFERGAGETLACGSGACAAVVVGRQQGWLDATVRVDLPGGPLTIHWPGPGEPVTLTGPAETVFEGRIDHDPPV